MERKVKVAVKVIIHPGKKTEKEFKEAVEKYVRSWIFDKKGNDYEEKNKMVQPYSIREWNNQHIIAN